MPDLQLETGDGPTQVYSLLQRAEPVLINLAAPDSIDLGPWADQVHLVSSTYDGRWQLPVIGAVAAPGAVLVRPDGHVAWVSDGTSDGLLDALATWFGPRPEVCRTV